ncbi:MAG: sigma 54-interacting transcriptional regulator [Bdellovibrionota bacterium]
MNQTKWNIETRDPSGETRIIGLSSELNIWRLGREPSLEIAFRDLTLPAQVAILRQNGADQSETERGFWLKMEEQAPAARIWNTPARNFRVPENTWVEIGDSKFRMARAQHKRDLPACPASVKPWHTVSETGAKTLWLAKKISATPLSVYLSGETGTGKEVLAQLVHSWSPRAAGPFVPINCGALPLSLAESELFGHVKGAYTGASHQRPGALLQAHNGTLFLDEIGDLPLDIQVKLLRFLENGEIRPVGADHIVRADVRIVCATHQSLKQLVAEGKFRRDLYYRLASVSIEIPTLRSRPDDLKDLAVRFARELGREIHPQAILRLQAYSWPGNVRELRHAIERASGMSGPFEKVLSEESFEFLLTPDSVSARPEIEIGSVLTLVEMEKALLVRALRLSDGNRAKAARILGVARSTLFEMVKRHRIPGPRYTMVA